MAYSLCVSGLLMYSGVSFGQNSEQLSVNPDSQPSNQRNYRSSEQMTQNPKISGNNQTSDFINGTQSRSLPDPAIAIFGDQFEQHRWLYEGTWISSIGTLLLRDQDEDGYFSGFSFTIDVDTHYQSDEVYVVIDIQRAFAQRERLHTSSDFWIHGNSLADEYRIDIDLLTNYQAGDYDVFITLRDAYNDQILDHISATDFSNLYHLPLESEDLDIAYEIEHNNPPLPPNSQPENDDIQVVEYAGSSGIALMLLLLGSLAIRPASRHRLR